MLVAVLKVVLAVVVVILAAAGLLAYYSLMEDSDHSIGGDVW